MDFSLLLSSYATVWSNPEVLLMTFIGALGGVLLGAIPVSYTHLTLPTT